MPDWVIHMAGTHAMARPLGRWDWRWVMLGAVFPDAIPRVIGTLVHKIDALEPLRSLSFGMCLGFLHTPVSVTLLITALVVFAVDRRAAALGLGFGATTHFAMDVMQRSYGGGTPLLYPFDLHPVSLQVVWYENPATVAVVVLSSIYVLWVTVAGRGSAEFPLRSLSWRRASIAAPALAVCACLPLLCFERAVAIDLGNSLLVSEPERFENTRVEVSVAGVVDTRADAITVEKAAADLDVVWRGMPAVEVGDTVSFRGVYRNGTITADEAFLHDYTLKTVASLIGVVMLVLMWAPSLTEPLRRRANPNDSRPVTPSTRNDCPTNRPG